MSTKQPHCLTTMDDLLTPASKAYLVTFELIQVCIKKTHSNDSSEMERFMFTTFVQKIHCMECLMDHFLPTADAKAKRDFVDSDVKPQQRLVT